MCTPSTRRVDRENMESFHIGEKKLSELRVVDLRQELEKRGLEKSGNKAVLIERLEKALLEDEPNNCEDQLADIANSEAQLLEEEDVPEEEAMEGPPKKNAEHQNDNDGGVDVEDFDPDEFEVHNSFELEIMDGPSMVDEVLDLNKMPDIFDVDSSKEEAGNDDDDEEEEEKKDEKKEDEEKEDDEFEVLHLKEEISGDDTKVEEENHNAQEDTAAKEVKVNTESDASRDNSLSVSLFVHTDEFQDDLDDDLKEAEEKAAEKKASKKKAAKEDNKANETEMEVSVKNEEEASEVKADPQEKEEEEATEKMEVVQSDKAAETTKKSATTKEAKTQGDGPKKDEPKKDEPKKDEPKKKAVAERKSTRSSSGATKDKKETGKSLWVSNLSSVTRAADLKTRFSQYGKVVGAKIVTNSKAPGAQCFGLVTMSTSEEAAKCISHLHRTELHGKTITVDRAKGDRIPTTQSQGSSAKKQVVKKDKPDSSAKGKEKANKAKVEEKKQPEKAKKPADAKASAAKTTGKTTPKTGNKTVPKAQKSGSSTSSIKKGDEKVTADKSKGDAAASPAATKDSEKEKDDKSKDKDKSEKSRSSSQAKSESSNKDDKARGKIKSLEEIRKERQEHTRQDNAKRIREQRERERQDRLRRERERVEHERAMERARERERERERERRRQQLLREREIRERQERERLRLQREMEKQREMERTRERERVLRERREREERERLERERRERERIERDRLDRLERDRLQRVERERAQRQRIETDRLDRERVERERLDRERLNRERLDRERLAQRDHMERGRTLKRPAPPIERGGAGSDSRAAGFWQDTKRATVGERGSREFFGVPERSPRRSDDRRERLHRDESREVRGQRTEEFSRVDERRPNKNEHRSRSDSEKERDRGGRDKPLRDHDREGRGMREPRDRDSRGHQGAKSWLNTDARAGGVDSQKSLSMLLERAGVSGILGSSSAPGSVGKTSDLAVQSLATRGEAWRRSDPRDSRAPATNVFPAAPGSELQQSPQADGRFSTMPPEPNHRGGAGLPGSENEKGGRHWRSAQRGADQTSRAREQLVTRERGEQRGPEPKTGSHPYDSRDTRPPTRDAAPARGTWGSGLDSRQSANPAIALTNAGRQGVESRSRGGLSMGGRESGLSNWAPPVSSLATPVNRSYDGGAAPGPDRRHVGAAEVRYDPYKAAAASRGGVMRRY